MRSFARRSGRAGSIDLITLILHCRLISDTINLCFIEMKHRLWKKTDRRVSMVKLLPEEILCGVFSKCSQDLININTYELHRLFFRMRMDPRTSALLDDFLFKGSPISPYSEVVANALFNLQFSMKISKADPDLTKYTKTAAFHAYYNNALREKLAANPEIDETLAFIAREMIAEQKSAPDQVIMR